jgi:hypothetical protein
MMSEMVSASGNSSTSNISSNVSGISSSGTSLIIIIITIPKALLQSLWMGTTCNLYTVLHKS